MYQLYVTMYINYFSFSTKGQTQYYLHCDFYTSAIMRFKYNAEEYRIIQIAQSQ